MPKLSLTPHGIKAGRSAGCNRTPPKRGTSKGWSASTSRRNRDFLKSIDPTQLDGHAVSASLTLGRSSRLSATEFKIIRENLFKRLARAGITRHHWLTEFQKDGTPHLHMMIFFPLSIHPNNAVEAVREHWLEVSEATGSRFSGQDVVAMYHLQGWLKYLAKHGSRGADHYQRNQPKGWETPGRMWGKSGTWPTSILEYDCDTSTFYRLRRWVRNWRLSDARRALTKARRYCDEIGTQNALRRIRSARQLLNRGTRQKSELMGFDEWTPPEIINRMIDALMRVHGSYIRDYSEHKETPNNRFDARGAQT